MNAAVRASSFFANVLVGILSFFLAFPLFILVYYRLPNLEWPYHTDKILVFFVIAIFINTTAPIIPINKNNFFISL